METYAEYLHREDNAGTAEYWHLLTLTEIWHTPTHTHTHTHRERQTHKHTIFKNEHEMKMRKGKKKEAICLTCSLTFSASMFNTLFWKIKGQKKIICFQTEKHWTEQNMSFGSDGALGKTRTTFGLLFKGSDAYITVWRSLLVMKMLWSERFLEVFPFIYMLRCVRAPLTPPGWLWSLLSPV
jgi:hypothetical protein